jgi:F1F0 ATPase subunit 2
MFENPAQLSLAFVAGAALGAVYLAVLWATVRRVTTSRRPNALLFTSATLRIGLLLAGWYWVADGRWDGLLACLLGFIAVRLVATRLVVRGGAKHSTTF